MSCSHDFHCIERQNGPGAEPNPIQTDMVDFFSGISYYLVHIALEYIPKYWKTLKLRLEYILLVHISQHICLVLMQK